MHTIYHKLYLFYVQPLGMDDKRSVNNRKVVNDTNDNKNVKKQADDQWEEWQKLDAEV